MTEPLRLDLAVLLPDVADALWSVYEAPHR